MSRRLWLLLALALVLRLAFFTGLRGSDDLRYAALAKAHVSGAPLIPPSSIALNDTGALRPAFTGGVSLAVSCLGFSEAALMAYPMLCSLGLVALLYQVALCWLGEAAALGAGLAAAVLPGFVLAGSSLYPDLPMTLWISIALVLLWSAPGRGIWMRPAAFASGACFCVAVHHKEAAALLLPVLGWLALTRSRRALVLWVGLGLASLAILPWDGYLPRKTLGVLRPLADRSPEKAIPSGPGPVHRTLNTTSSLPRRLLWDFTEPLLSPMRPGLFSLWAGIAWLAAGGAWLGLRERSKPLLACMAWAGLSFLALDVFGVPGKGYYPLSPVSPRYLALVMPPLVLMAGAFSAWVWPRMGRLRWAAAFAAAVILLGFNLAAAAPNRAYGKALQVSLETLGRAGGAEVWTDRRTAEGLRLFIGESRIRIFPEGNPEPASGLVVVNGPVLDYLAREYRDPVPPWIRNPPPEWTCLADETIEGLLPRKGGEPLRKVSVYRIGAVRMPGLLAAAAPGVSSGITPRQRIVVTLMGLGLIAFIFELVRRRRLREEYSWLWMLSGAVILFFALYDPALLWITGFIGAGLPTTTFFFFGLFFLILISIHYAVKISTLTTQQKNLMQELALLKEQLERDKRP